MRWDKSGIWRSEEHRRLVALLPCMNCGVHGYTQAAHGGRKYGKAGSRKASDAAVAALCGPRMGIAGCHADFDSGGKIPKDEREAWFDGMLAKTKVAMIEAGWLGPTDRALRLLEEKRFRSEYSG